jgi:hypothetical protein
VVAYRWSAEKDAALQAERGFGFGDVVAALEGGGMLEDLPNASKNHRGQRVLLVALGGYAVIVPYVRDGDTLFLKTAYPSRKMTRRYIGG